MESKPETSSRSFPYKHCIWECAWKRSGALLIFLVCAVSGLHCQVISIDDPLTAPDPILWTEEGREPGAGSVSYDTRGLILNLQPGAAARGISSTWSLSGDFDVEVAITLINWPVNNLYGVRLGAADLGTGPFGEIGIYREGGREFYTVAFTNGSLHSATVNLDRVNKLRLKRQGGLLSGFFLANGGSNWVQVGGTAAVGPVSTAQTHFNLDVSSSNPSAGGVTVAFSNFHVNAGLLSCPVSQSSFADIMKNSVAQADVFPGTINTSFRPGGGVGLNLSLAEAACLGGYDHFNWKQTVLSDSLLLVCPLCAQGLLYIPEGSVLPTLPQAPFIDPPHGGYLYEVIDKCQPLQALVGGCWFPARDNFDWYWDEKYSDAGRLPDTGSTEPDLRITELAFWTSDVLTFADTPVCPFYLTSLGVGDLCTVNFSTNLVGVKRDKTGEVLAFMGTGFNWHLVGTTIGLDPRLSATGPIDAGTLVYFDGFKPPGATGFTQPELELLAKNGITIRDEIGVTRPVTIDVKPGEFPNSINPRNHGTIPVAIISTTGFYAPDQVDQPSLTFGHTGDETSLAFCSAEDINGDGLVDLVCHFYTSIAAFQPNDTAGILKGKSLSGMSLYGTDSVRIVPAH